MRLSALLLMCACAWASDCTRTATGFVPLNDLGSGLYRGAAGGLYPGGVNRPPEAHLRAGLRLGSEVVPRDAAGRPDASNGKIVLLSVGMSNTTQEFSAFKPLADGDSQKNPRLVIVDGAQGGWSADRIVAGGATFWSTLEQRLLSAGVTAAQVQTAWMKEADAGPKSSFPEDARQLQRELATLAQTLRSRFPNLRLLYLSSRIYAGYASTALNPEPYAYQSGFAVKWLIEQQIGGDPELSYDAGKAPWMAWGPYLWADGMKPRSDGLTWACSELNTDGTHPGETGRRKVARMLLDFFKADATARPWFLKSSEGAPPPAVAAVVNAAAFVPGVAPGSFATVWGAGLASATEKAQTLPLPLSMGQTSVEIDGVPCLLHYVSPTQINVIAPAGASAGSVTVIRDGAPSAPVQFDWRPHAPALFTVDGRAAAAQHLDYRPVTPQDAVGRSKIVILYGTGFGIAPNPVLRIGGVRADVLFAGPVPGSPGLDQINATVPVGAPLGNVEIQFEASGAAAPPVTLPVN